MKYPKIKAEWEPISNLHVNVTSQELKIYVNGSLKEQRVFDRWAREHEFFIPAWDAKGNLLEEQTRIYFTVEAKTDNFSSETITSNVIQLESISIKEKPTDLKVSVMPFPQFYQEFDSPIFVVGSGVN
tara:strand:- start:49873 stop:50256 length:384 start_codon:yes stop_codon:yes gene_type:complete